MTLVCDPSSPCSAAIGWQNLADSPVVTFQANPGEWISKLSMAPKPVGTHSLGTLTNVVSNKGNPIPSSGTSCVGECPPAVGSLQLVDCSAAGGIQGFVGSFGTEDDKVQPLCVDGNPPSPALTGFSTGGSTFGPISCPVNTHRLSSIKGSTGCTPGGGGGCVTTINFTCSSFAQLCQGSTLNTPECQAYCSSHVGSCDAALKAYCQNPDGSQRSNPICGCALEDSAYPFLGLKDPSGASVPIACAQGCTSNSAIKLASTGTCNINTICVSSNNQATALQSSIKGSISFSQSCGNTGSTSSTSSGSLGFLTSTTGLIIIAVVVLVIIILIIIIIVSARRRRQKKADQQKKDELEQQRVQQLQQLRTASVPQRKPTVVRLS